MTVETLVGPHRPPQQPTASLLGQKLGHYRITELLGNGGMGEIYGAQDETLERKVIVANMGQVKARPGEIKDLPHASA